MHIIKNAQVNSINYCYLWTHFLRQNKQNYGLKRKQIVLNYLKIRELHKKGKYELFGKESSANSSVWEGQHERLFPKLNLHRVGFKDLGQT